MQQKAEQLRYNSTGRPMPNWTNEKKSQTTRPYKTIRKTTATLAKPTSMFMSIAITLAGNFSAVPIVCASGVCVFFFSSFVVIRLHFCDAFIRFIFSYAYDSQVVFT